MRLDGRRTGPDPDAAACGGAWDTPPDAASVSGATLSGSQLGGGAEAQQVPVGPLALQAAGGRAWPAQQATDQAGAPAWPAQQHRPTSVALKRRSGAVTARQPSRGAASFATMAAPEPPPPRGTSLSFSQARPGVASPRRTLLHTMGSVTYRAAETASPDSISRLSGSAPPRPRPAGLLVADVHLLKGPPTSRDPLQVLLPGL